MFLRKVGDLSLYPNFTVWMPLPTCPPSLMSKKLHLTDWRKFFCGKNMETLATVSQVKMRKGPCTRPNMSLEKGIAGLRESEGIQSRERDRHRSPVVAKEMSRQEVMLLLVALASLVQGQQLFNCQQRCGQFYVEFQKVREKNSLWQGGKPLSSLRGPSLHRW